MGLGPWGQSAASKGGGNPNESSANLAISQAGRGGEETGDPRAADRDRHQAIPGRGEKLKKRSAGCKEEGDSSGEKNIANGTQRGVGAKNLGQPSSRIKRV